MCWIKTWSLWSLNVLWEDFYYSNMFAFFKHKQAADNVCGVSCVLINELCLLSVQCYFCNQSCWREAGGGRPREGKRGGKEGRISFYFPPQRLKSKIFCRVLKHLFPNFQQPLIKAKNKTGRRENPGVGMRRHAHPAKKPPHSSA